MIRKLWKENNAPLQESTLLSKLQLDIDVFKNNTWWVHNVVLTKQRILNLAFKKKKNLF